MIAAKMRPIAMNLITYGLIIVYLAMCAQDCVGQTILSEVTANLENDTEIVKTQKVDAGKTAVLSCHSNDRDHFFSFWQLAKNDAVVGPGNKYDIFKYGYEILSGSLIIQEVSTAEEGVYNCVSRGVKGEDINIRSVRMVVSHGWEEDNDTSLYYFRGAVIVLSLVVIAGAVYFAYRLKRRHRLQSLLEEESDEEDSADEIFRAPGTSRGTGNIVLDRADDPEDVPKISIDFEDILNNSHNLPTIQ